MAVVELFETEGGARGGVGTYARDAHTFPPALCFEPNTALARPGYILLIMQNGCGRCPGVFLVSFRHTLFPYKSQKGVTRRGARSLVMYYNAT